MQTIYSMDNFDPSSIPDGFSHRQLSNMLQSALPDAVVPEDDSDQLVNDLTAWALGTQHLLQRLSQESDAIGRNRSPQQVMALGSFRTHLMLGLQALQASQT